MDIIESLDILYSYGWTLIPFGLFIGLFGYRLYRIAIFVIGLFLGFWLGSLIGDVFENSQLGLILGILLGLIFAIASNSFIRFSLFVAGVVGGIAIISLVDVDSLVSANVNSLVWFAGSGLAVGLLTLIFYRFLILVLTSFIGTYMIYIGSVDLLELEGFKWVYIVIFAVFFLVQISTRKGHAFSLGRRRR